MKKEDCYQLGTITKPHGLKGALTAHFDVDYPDDYVDLEMVLVEIKKGQLEPFFVEDVRFKGEEVILVLEEITDIDKALKLKNCALYLPLDELPELPAGQFYFHEIIGYQVIDKIKGNLGKVENVIELSPQTLVQMMYEGREVLIPLVEQIVTKVDKDNKVLETNLPDGLLEL
jgi:16S rRNA processing protein RimM